MHRNCECEDVKTLFIWRLAQFGPIFHNMSVVGGCAEAQHFPRLRRRYASGSAFGGPNLKSLQAAPPAGPAALVPENPTPCLPYITYPPPPLVRGLYINVILLLWVLRLRRLR